MQHSPNTPHGTVNAIGQLCFGGDWACAHGDASGLRHVVQQIAERSAEPLHCALIALADQCCDEPDRAVGDWPAVKELVLRTIDS
jgi:hypothetical protein